MSNWQHTPGPWVAVEVTAETPLASGVPIAVQRAGWAPDSHGRICELIAQGEGRYDPAATTANAYLIAAAPDLLREARGCLEFLEDLEASDNPAVQPVSVQAAGFFMSVAGLRDAITKAEGRS